MSGAVEAGLRDKWVTIQTRPDVSVSTSGFPIDAPWSDLATVAMWREDQEVAEVERGNQRIGQNRVRWEMPYMLEMDPERVDVQKLRRLVYCDRVFDILGGMPVGRAESIALYTEAFGKLPTEAIP